MSIELRFTLTMLISSQIIGAPSFFPTVWGWIKKWFDPITTSKIFILSQHQVLPTLLSFIDIANIPKKYGGQLDFECGKMPILDQQVRDCLNIASGAETEKLFLTAPVRWIDAGDDGEMTAIGVGSMDGKQREESVATLHSLAVRVATNASRHAQSQKGIDIDQVPPTYHTTLPTHTLPQEKATLGTQPFSIQQPTPQDSQPTSIQPAPDAKPSTAYLGDKPAPAGGTLQNPLHQNGGPPEKISMPPPPTSMERMKTEYMTPPSDPSEIPKNLDSHP